MKRFAAAGLTVTVLACGSAHVEDPPSIRHVLATPEPIPFEEPTHWVIEQAHSEVDAVLVVKVSVPGLFDDAAFRFPLQRREAPGNYRPPFTANDDVAADDEDEGYSGGVNILGATADTIKVEADFVGRGENGKDVNVTQTFSIPWLGQFDGDFNGTGHIRAAFERVPPNR
jgi:hypothetical protein